MFISSIDAEFPSFSHKSVHLLIKFSSSSFSHPWLNSLRWDIMGGNEQWISEKILIEISEKTLAEESEKTLTEISGNRYIMLISRNRWVQSASVFLKLKIIMKLNISRDIPVGLSCNKDPIAVDGVQTLSITKSRILNKIKNMKICTKLNWNCLVCDKVLMKPTGNKIISYKWN